jgi:nucleoside-diphosphate-sugar epimerase
MRQETIAVTGASGYIGGALCDSLSTMGYRVQKLVRNPQGDGDAHFDLKKRVFPSLESVDVLIHAAWDLTESSWEGILKTNVAASQALLEHAYAQGVSTVIFISSMAAFPKCESLYGRSKLLVEEAFQARKAIVVRPGTVWGGPREGGIVKAIRALLKKFRVAPLIGGGAHTLYTVHVDDLLLSISSVLEHRDRLEGRCIVAAHPTPITLRSFVQALADAMELKCVLLPIPAFCLYVPLRLLELCKVTPPLRSDSVTSITQGASKELYSQPPEVKVNFRPLESF